MTNFTKRPAITGLALAITLAAITGAAHADGELNLYSSRHYDTDERLYSDFEAQTGITINRIEDKADKLIERMRAEGVNSPADVLLTVDAGRIWRADQAGLLQPVNSDILNAGISKNLRHPNGHWFGFSQRARLIFYSKSRVAEPPQTYEDLADAKYEGKICTRSSSNIYMLSLMASMIEHDGEEGAKAWGEGLWGNRARDPQGGDTDQLRGIVSGECDIVLANHYYYVRGRVGDVRNLTDGIDDIGVVFPNQGGRGAHVNISAGALATYAPNRDNAVKFLEYLASPQAQEYLANGNNEFPAVEGVALGAGVSQLGSFDADPINLSVYGENQPTAQRLYNEIGYQ